MTGEGVLSDIVMACVLHYDRGGEDEGAENRCCKIGEELNEAELFSQAQEILLQNTATRRNISTCTASFTARNNTKTQGSDRLSPSYFQEHKKV